MFILDQLEELKRKVGHDLELLEVKQAHMFQSWVITRSDWVFEQLREHRPILKLGKQAVVTKYADVVEVLGNEDVFSVRLYVPKITRTSGPEILQYPRGHLRDHDSAVLNAAIRREDLPRIAEMARASAAELIEPHVQDGKLDVVSDLGDHLGVRVVGDYFGVPGPDDATMMGWARAIFEDVFGNLADATLEREAGLQASKEWRAYLDKLIKQRHAEMDAGNEGPDDVLGRFLKMQTNGQENFSDEGIAGNFIGMMTGGVDSISTMITHVVYELLQHPEHLEGARQAVRDGNDALLAKYTREALRFRPQNTLLFRFCERTYTLASGTDRETEIEDGTTVLAMMTSAMMDEDKIEAPREFRIDRPDDNYLHFGYGLHVCFGRHIARLHVQEATKALLRLENLRVVGDVEYNGIFPRSLVVEFDPPAGARTGAEVV